MPASSTTEPGPQVDSLIYIDEAMKRHAGRHYDSEHRRAMPPSPPPRHFRRRRRMTATRPQKLEYECDVVFLFAMSHIVAAMTEYARRILARKSFRHSAKCSRMTSANTRVKRHRAGFQIASADFAPGRFQRRSLPHFEGAMKRDNTRKLAASAEAKSTLFVKSHCRFSFTLSCSATTRIAISRFAIMPSSSAYKMFSLSSQLFQPRGSLSSLKRFSCITPIQHMSSIHVVAVIDIYAETTDRHYELYFVSNELHFRSISTAGPNTHFLDAFARRA